MAVRYLCRRTAIKSGTAEGEKMEKEKNVNEASPRALPVVLFKGEQYFADLRLNEFRPVRGFESIPFDSEEGVIMSKDTGVVTCKSCGMSAIISKAFEEQQLRCMRCFSRELVPLYEEHRNND